MFKKSLSIAAGIVVAAVSIAPANAVLVNGVDWVFGPDGFSEVEGGDFGSYGLDSSEFEISEHGVDNFFVFSCSGTEETEPDGDVINDCGDFIASGVTGIDWTGHIKVFGGDGGGTVARQVVSLKNTTSEDIVIDYEYYLDTEETYVSNGDEGTIGTPDGDLTVETGETWWAGANDNDALEGIAFGNDGYARGDGGDNAVDEGYGVVAEDTIIDEAGIDEFYSWNDAGVTVPGGETINFVYFYSSVGSADRGNTAPLAYTDAEFNEGMAALFSDPSAVVADPRLMEGIVGDAYNWGEVPGSGPEDELAETGLDAFGVAFGGALAIIAGIGVYAVRRRRALV